MGRYILLSLLLLTVAGCAIGDVPGQAEVTPLPPLTIAPPQTAVFAGDCENTPELDAWLQSATLFVAEFQTGINTILTQDRAEMYETVVHLARVRDATHNTVTPACAEDLQRLMLDMMDGAVTTLQAYVNGDTDDLGNLLPETIATIDRIIAGQNELITQLEAQFQAQNDGE